MQINILGQLSLTSISQIDNLMLQMSKPISRLVAFVKGVFLQPDERQTQFFSTYSEIHKLNEKQLDLFVSDDVSI